MINRLLRPAELHKQYRVAEPFPHLVIDDFLETPVADAVASELEAADIGLWHRDDQPDQVEKSWMDDLEKLPPAVSSALAYFNSAEALAFFETLTGIPHLIADPGYLGGGVHVTGQGGMLSVHADFNLHPTTGYHRRVNALLYLNRDWDPQWNGQLELWPSDLSAPTHRIEPSHNRLAVFTITDTAFHGVPQPLQCPPDRKRFSLALYYYTEDRPDEEKGPFHWATWQHTEVQAPTTQ